MESKLRLIFVILISIVLGFHHTYGQGTVRGKIIDENGIPLVGATVFMKSDVSKGTISDLEGTYSLSISHSVPQIISISYVGYNMIVDTIIAKKGEVVISNYIMSSASEILGDVFITAKQKRSNDVYMEYMKAKSAISLDYISSETIKKTGDSDIHSAAKRISGVSTLGSFITVRGLADRYIKSTINGSRIPTLDPFTNNIKLDMFPTSLVDNIIVSKTLSPELPGDWAGAFLSIETKDYPEKLTINVSSTFGYNSNTTFKRIITSRQSPTDWLGFDNGYREIAHFERYDFPMYNDNPTPYQEFGVLGLESYLESLGINSSHLGYGSEGNIYYRLSLIQLQLLQPALIYNAEAIDQANGLFKTQKENEALKLLNSDLENFGKTLPNNWSSINSTAPLNHSQEFSIGNQTTLFGKSLGYLFGFRYNRSIQYDPASTLTRASDIAGSELLSISDSINQQASVQATNWSTLFNLAYKFNTHNSVSFMFMPNQTGNNKARRGEGLLPGAEGDAHIEDQIYEERTQLVYQVKSKHYIPGHKIRMESDLSYTIGHSSIPDFKNVEYFSTVVNDSREYFFTNRGLPPRYYRYLNENILDMHMDIEIPLLERPDLARVFKFGFAYQENTREYKQFNYQAETSSFGNSIENGIIEDYFDLNNFSFRVNRLPIYYSMDTSFVNFARNFATGYSRVTSGYSMIDFNLTNAFRLAGGLRIEKSNIFSDLDLLLGLPEDHYKRDEAGPGTFIANPANINEIYFLPSVNLLYKIINNNSTNLTARLNYSHSIARPSIREVTYNYVFDYEYRLHVLGNPELKTVGIDNYDLRVESSFRNNNNASLSLFYKSFTNHIEVVETFGYNTWQNANESKLLGIEIETKYNITDKLELRANVTLINSRTTLNLGGYTGQVVTQEMYGQAPYIVNGLLSYNNQELGFNASISYNLQGPRLAIINQPPVPNVFELERHLLDLKISKSLKKFGVSFKIRNILNEPVVRAYDYKDWSIVYDRFRYGVDYSISLSYNL